MNPLVSMETKITMEVLPRHFERYALALFFLKVIDICKLYSEIIRYRQYLNIYGWNKTISLMYLQFQREVWLDNVINLRQYILWYTVAKPDAIT